MSVYLGRSDEAVEMKVSVDTVYTVFSERLESGRNFKAAVSVANLEPQQPQQPSYRTSQLELMAEKGNWNPYRA